MPEATIRDAFGTSSPISLPDESPNVNLSSNLDPDDPPDGDPPGDPKNTPKSTESPDAGDILHKGKAVPAESSRAYPVPSLQAQTPQRETVEVWIKKHPWVKPLWAKDDSGQTVLQKVFCSCCQQAEEQRLLSGEAKRKSTYTTIGYTDWHNATDRFTKHEGSSTHRTALTRVKPGCMDPIAMVSSAKRREMEEARAALHQIFGAIQYLAGQGLAFRRKEEDVGNFSRLLDLLQETSPELRRFRALRSANNYTSPDIQNEILSILGNAVCYGRNSRFNLD